MTTRVGYTFRHLVRTGVNPSILGAELASGPATGGARAYRQLQELRHDSCGYPTCETKKPT